jgi:NADPH-dependent 2,4-dienoyl-CoA reductase/sulfur reductase-like enzyme
VDLKLAEQVLEEGKADFIQMGRPLIANPDLPLKVIAGELGEINWCIRCGECHGHDRDNLRRPVFRCSVNAFAGREADPEWVITPAVKSKKVLVVGGGPGGLETARVAALRGHDVTIYEKDHELGGAIKLAAKPPEKEEMGKTITYLAHQLEKLGVEVKLGVTVTPELVISLNLDTVILATGSSPLIPDIPGVEGDNVITVSEVLTGKAKAGKNVVVLGGGPIGAEVADWLAGNRKKVTIIEIRPLEELQKDRGRGAPTRLQKEYYPDLWGIATELPRRYRMLLLKRLGAHGVKTLFGAETEEITDKGLTVRQGEKRRFIEADTVVLAAGDKPNNDLYKTLFGKVPQILMIGDCIKPRRLMEAISEGAYVGLTI